MTCFINQKEKHVSIRHNSISTLMKSGASIFHTDIMYMIYLDMKHFSVVGLSIYYKKHIAILFLCHVFPFASKGLDFTTLKYPWILNQNVFFFKKRIFFQSVLCRMDKCNLFLSTNVLLFDVLIILIHHFVLFFSIHSQKKKFYVKRKNTAQSSCMNFFVFFYFRIIYQSDITMNISNTHMQHVICYSAIQSSI